MEEKYTTVSPLVQPIATYLNNTSTFSTMKTNLQLIAAYS